MAAILNFAQFANSIKLLMRGLISYPGSSLCLKKVNMSGRFIKIIPGVIRISCSPQVKIILWKPFSLPSASSPIRKRTKLKTFKNCKAKRTIRRKRPGAKAKAVFVYFMGVTILAGSSGHVIFA